MHAGRWLVVVLILGCARKSAPEQGVTPPPPAADAAAPSLPEDAAPMVSPDTRAFDYAPFDDAASAPVPDTQPFTVDVSPPSDVGELPPAPVPVTPVGCDALGTGPAASLAYSPDGSLLAVGTFFGAVVLYRADTLAPAGSLWAGLGEISSIDFSADGAFLVAAARDEAVRVFRMATLAPVSTLQLPASKIPQVRTARFSADGATVFTGFATDAGTFLGRFRASDGVRLSATVLGTTPSSLAALLMTPDRTRMVLMGDYFRGQRQVVEVRRTDDQTRLYGFAVDPEAAIALSSDGRLLAYGPDVSSHVRVVRSEDGKEVVAIPVLRVRSMIFSPDGTQLIMGQPGDPPYHLTARLSTGSVEKRVSRLDARSAGNLTFATSPDGKVLVYGFDNGIELTSAVDGTLLKPPARLREGVNRVAVSPDGMMAAVLYPDQVVFWPLAGDRTTHTVKLTRNSDGQAAFSRDGKRLVVAGQSVVGVYDTAGQSWAVREFLDQIVGVGFSFDGALVGATSPGIWFKLYEGATGKALFEHRGDVSDARKAWIPLAFSPREKQAAVGAGVGAVFDTETHAILRMLPASVTALAYLPDGSELAVGTSKITFQRADTGAETRSLPGLGQYLTDLAFSGDGKLMLARGAGTGWRLTRLADGSDVPGIPAGGAKGIGGNKLVSAPQPGALAVFCELK
jgi:WD40 repeat protein